MNSTIRNFLRKQAHNLKPVVMIGKNGLTRNVEAAVDAALQSHELIKIKFLDYKESRRELTEQAARSVSADVVARIGNTAVLFRQNPEPEQQHIILPS